MKKRKKVPTHTGANATSNAEFEAGLAARIADYQRVANTAGVHFKCLDADEDDEFEPATAEVENDEGNVIVRVSGPIDGWFGIDVRDIIARLDEAEPTAIHLLVESPGGFLHDGMALYADLRARARQGVEVTTEARGLVASAATLLYLAGDERAAESGSNFMVHRPFGFMFAIGNADDIVKAAQQTANGLRNADKSLTAITAERAGVELTKAAKWLNDETWFTADEAREAGIVNADIDEKRTTEKSSKQATAAAKSILAAHAGKRNL